jgi:hypothetical protein
VSRRRIRRVARTIALQTEGFRDADESQPDATQGAAYVRDLLEFPLAVGLL